MTLTAAGIRGWESAVWRSVAALRRSEYGIVWLSGLNWTLALPEAIAPWDCLRLGLASGNEAKPAQDPVRRPSGAARQATPAGAKPAREVSRMPRPMLRRPPRPRGVESANPTVPSPGPANQQEPELARPNGDVVHALFRRRRLESQELQSPRPENRQAAEFARPDNDVVHALLRNALGQASNESSARAAKSRADSRTALEPGRSAASAPLPGGDFRSRARNYESAPANRRLKTAAPASQRSAKRAIEGERPTKDGENLVFDRYAAGAELTRQKLSQVLDRKLSTAISRMRPPLPGLPLAALSGQAPAVLEQAAQRTLDGTPAPAGVLIENLSRSIANEQASGGTRTLAPKQFKRSSQFEPNAPGKDGDERNVVPRFVDPRQSPVQWAANRAAQVEADETPLQPVGLASRDSMPAPDVPLSVVRDAAGSVSRVAPPQATPSLPPLVPAQVSAPPAYGLAGPLTRVVTRREDSPDSPVDLVKLAENIKSILQEEARRHGIPV